MSLSCWIQFFAETLPKCSLLGAIAGAPPLALPQTLAYRALFESWIGELSALPPGSLLVGVLSSHTMPQSRLLEEGWTNTVIPWVEIPPREFDRCKLHSPKQTQPSTQHKRLCEMSCCIGCNLVQHNVDRIHGLCQVLVGQDWCGCDQGHSLTYWHIWSYNVEEMQNLQQRVDKHQGTSHPCQSLRHDEAWSSHLVILWVLKRVAFLQWRLDPVLLHDVAPLQCHLLVDRGQADPYQLVK